MRVQESVKKETAFVALSTLAGCMVMLLVFFFLHQRFPEQVPFDYRVLLSAGLGAAVAAGDFFFMGLTVQEVVSMEDRDLAIGKLRLSYRYRTLGKLFWLVLCMLLPCFHLVAGFVPLVLPSIFIKARGILAHFHPATGSGQTGGSAEADSAPGSGSVGQI